MKELKLSNVPGDTGAALHYLARIEGKRVPEIARELLIAATAERMHSAVTQQVPAAT